MKGVVSLSFVKKEKRPFSISQRAAAVVVVFSLSMRRVRKTKGVNVVFRVFSLRGVFCPVVNGAATKTETLKRTL